MLTWSELVTLEHSLRDSEVLSVYLDGRTDDPSTRRAWHVRLHQALRDIRTWIADSPAAERDRFERCVSLVEQTLASVGGALGSTGWCAFVTGESVRYADALPVPVPTLAVWATGASVAPYVRALKQHRPVIVAVADAKHAALYRYQGGVLQELEEARSRLPGAHGRRMGAAPSPGFHAGVRGGTGHDEGQREQLEATDRMLKSAARRMARLAGQDGWIVAGGAPITAGRLLEMLPRRLAGRFMRLESLDVHAPLPEIKLAAELASSSLRDASDLHRVEELAVVARKGGRAAIGAADTRRALDERRVRELYVTQRSLLAHPMETEAAVRSAFDQDAVVEEVSGAAAARLDALGGFAARLHSRLTQPEEMTPGVAGAAATEGLAPPEPDDAGPGTGDAGPMGHAVLALAR